MTKAINWLIGAVTIITFPFTLVALALYIVFIKIPMFFGELITECFQKAIRQWKK